MQPANHTIWRKAYVNKEMAPNVKLYQRNQHQKHEAIWTGRDTTTRQQITLTPEFGKLRSRTDMRLQRGQQIDKRLLLKVTTLTDKENQQGCGTNTRTVV
eukprot:2287186-Amphidinium_carterae.1